jgi:DNA sulfur modification protein DndB
MDTSFEYVFPAIRGIQAGREYYVSMCPLRLIPKIFIFNEEELGPELRAQRILNRSRIPEMAQYMVDNKNNYVFSAITASVNGDVQFDAYGEKGEISRIGTLKINMNSQFIINDGQHRRAAIEAALRKEPKLGDESIAVVFFVDRGLERCQQMFADLNRYAIRPSKSLGLLYDHRDDGALISRMVTLKSKTFSDLVEMEKSTLSPRSRKLFTLSAIHSANTALLNGKKLKDAEECTAFCIKFWDELGKYIKEWKLVKDFKITAGDVRPDYVHCHAIVLQALGSMGNKLTDLPVAEQRKRLKSLERINWKRSNAKAWEGRTMLGGRIHRGSSNVILTANYIKQRLKLELTPEEQRTEDAYKRGEYVQ